MDFLLKLCILHYIFLNFLVHAHAQDLLSSILGGVQNTIKLVNNNLNVGQRDYPDYGPLGNSEVSSSKFNDVSESNQNDSEEPENSNSEQRQGGYSNWNSDESDKENRNSIENTTKFPVNDQKKNNNLQNRSHIKQPGPFKGNIQCKPLTRKPALHNNQKPLKIKKGRCDKNMSKVRNKNRLNPHNVTTINSNESSTTSIPVVVLVNRTVIDNDIPNSTVVNDSLLKKNTRSSKNSGNSIIDKKVKKDNNKNVLKPLTKRKFYFQAKPVLPLSEEVSTIETVYYIDLD